MVILKHCEFSGCKCIVMTSKIVYLLINKFGLGSLWLSDSELFISDNNDEKLHSKRSDVRITQKCNEWNLIISSEITNFGWDYQLGIKLFRFQRTKTNRKYLQHRISCWPCLGYFTNVLHYEGFEINFTKSFRKERWYVEYH